MDLYTFIWCPNNSLKSNRVLRKVFLKINYYIPFLNPYFGAPGLLSGLKLKLPVYIIELYNSCKNWSFCMCIKKVWKDHFKIIVKFWDTLYQTAVKGSQGIILSKFRREILIQLQVIDDCDDCTTSFFAAPLDMSILR